MRKKKWDKDVIVLLITSLLMAGTWVGMEVYRAYKLDTTEADVSRHLVPLNPKLDTGVLEELEERQL